MHLQWLKFFKKDSGGSKESESKELSELDKEFEEIIEEHLANNDYDQTFNRTGMISSIFYLVVLILIGLPIWYRTTTPERWPLPDVSSLMVRSQTLVHHYKISIVFLDSNLESLVEFRELRQSLQNNYLRRMSYDSSLSFEQEWTVRAAFPKELDIFQSVLLADDGGPQTQQKEFLSNLDEKFSSSDIQLLNSIIFYVLPKSIETKSLVNEGNYRSFYLDLNHISDTSMNQDDDEEEDDIYSKLISAINEEVQSCQHIVEKLYTHLTNDNDQDIMLLLGRDFDFIFDIIYEDDNEENLVRNHQAHGQEDYLVERKKRHQKLTRNIDSLIEHFYTNRFGFSSFFKISFITQVLHYVFPKENFIRSNLIEQNQTSSENETSKDNPRLLPLSMVEPMLNHIESRRVQHDSEKSYHLTLYVSSQTNRSSPLKFYKNENETSNLIMTPFRGSILILNEIEQDLFDGFEQLIRAFFRLDSKNFSRKYFFTQLEIESVIRSLIQKHILKTLKSLESTERLLKTVSNMVIERKIAERMQQSVDDSMKAATLLSTSGDIRRSYELSWTAYSLGEKAFFDPSLLSLLYFPEDQKYAIYLPLFLPISLPILANLKYYAVFLFQWFRSSGSKKQPKVKIQ